MAATAIRVKPPEPCGELVKEIALIKAMQTRGKRAGFTAQKILSYFSRPERTINVARLYEIRDRTRGADIPAASDEELHRFLTRFTLEGAFQDKAKAPRRYTPVPAYLGVHQGRVCLLSRFSDEDDRRFTLRQQLLSEQHRLATVLAGQWSRFQVDQRLGRHMANYADLAAMDHSSLNVFALDDEFRVLRRFVGTESGGFGEIGEAQWDNFGRNHLVLIELYPEMREYRAALASTSPHTKLAEEEALQATTVLRDRDGQAYVAPEVPALIQAHLDEDTGGDPEGSRKRAYDVAALLNMTGALLWSILNALPKADQTSAAALSLWGRLWPLLRVVLQKMDW
jgi:hypothetical protein